MLSVKRTIAAATIAMGAAASLAMAPTALAAMSQTSTGVIAKANTCPDWTVKANRVNFRTGPSTRYASKGLLYKGDWGRRTSASGAWIKVKLGQKSKTGIKSGTTGWVHKKYLNQCVYTQY